MQSADRLLAPVVAEALGKLELAPEDGAAARLAERYAREIDGAGAVAAQADKVLRQVRDDPDTAELVAALRAKLGARAAVESLGPKLLQVLESLGATPKARAASRKGGGSGGGGKLERLRANRAG